MAAPGTAAGREPAVGVHCVIRLTYEDGRTRRLMRSADLRPDGSWSPVHEEDDASFLMRALEARLPAAGIEGLRPESYQAPFCAAVSVWEGELRAREPGVLSVQTLLTGVGLLGVSGRDQA